MRPVPCIIVMSSTRLAIDSAIGDKRDFTTILSCAFATLRASAHTDNAPRVARVLSHLSIVPVKGPSLLPLSLSLSLCLSRLSFANWLTAPASLSRVRVLSNLPQSGQLHPWPRRTPLSPGYAVPRAMRRSRMNVSPVSGLVRRSATLSSAPTKRGAIRWFSAP